MESTHSKLDIYSNGVFVYEMDTILNRAIAKAHGDFNSNKKQNNVELYLFWNEDKVMHLFERVNFNDFENDLKRVYKELLDNNEFQEKVNKKDIEFWDYSEGKDTVYIRSQMEEGLQLEVWGKRDITGMGLKARVKANPDMEEAFAVASMQDTTARFFKFYPMPRK